MTTVTLLQRPGSVRKEDFIKSLQTELDVLKGELSATITSAGFSKTGWARIEVRGGDHEILLELISRKYGKTRGEINHVELQGNYEGIVNREVDGTLEVDVGIESPVPVNVKINPSFLRAQLGNGRLIPGKELINLYCLHPGMKLTVRITHLEAFDRKVMGWLADSQTELFARWVNAQLDRIQVLDCTQNELEAAIKKAALERDIIEIEPLTLTAHSLLCKLGTDAIGLIPKLGSILPRRAQLKPFLPKRIMARCRQW